MVGTAPCNFLGPVDLFSQDEPDQLVREDQGRERPDEVGTLVDFGVDSVRSADDQGDVAGAVERLLEPGGEGGGVHGFSAFIEQDHVVGGVFPAEPFEEARGLLVPGGVALAGRVRNELPGQVKGLLEPLLVAGDALGHPGLMFPTDGQCA